MFFDKIPELTRKDGLYLKDLPDKGRGVFCKYDIKEGEVIEITPSLLLKQKDYPDQDSIIKNYVFMVEKVSRVVRGLLGVKNNKELSLLVMGVSSFCNNNPYPNLKYEQITTLYTIYFKLTAVKDIPKGTELCINYGENWFSLRKARN